MTPRALALLLLVAACSEPVAAPLLRSHDSGALRDDATPAPQTFYGPERFTRTTGAPTQFTRSISTLGFVAPFVLHVRNGAADGSSRISSAHVSADGVERLGPSDFSQTQGQWDIPVSLGNSATLTIQLASKPGSFLDISLTGIPHARFCPPATGDGIGYGDLSQAIEGTAAGQTIWICDGAHSVNAVPVDKAITIRAEHPGLATLVQPATALGGDAILSVNGVASGTVTVADLILSFVGTGIHAHGTYDQIAVSGVSFMGSGAGLAGTAFAANSSTVSGAHVVIDQSHFSHASNGIFQGQPVNFDTFNSTFEGLRGCLWYFSANGLQSPTSGAPQVRVGRVVGNTFTNCFNTILIEQIGIDTIRNNHIMMSSGGDGIFVYRPGQTAATTHPIVITDNVLEGHQPTGNPAAFSSWGIGWGVLDVAGVPGITDVVERNQISGAFAALDLENFGGAGPPSMLATDNRIADNYIAILRNTGSVVANNNDIVGYTFAVAAGRFRTPPFVGSSPNLPAGSLTCNWWGSASGPIGIWPTLATNVFTPWAVGPIANGAGGACTGGSLLAVLSAGAGHVCDLTSAGVAYCWGNNDNGELGDGTTTNRSTPVAVQGGLTFTSLMSATYHTCGLTVAGAAYCWGWNAGGSLGNGSTTQQVTPVSVEGGLLFTSLMTGSDADGLGVDSCGLTSGGAAYCWGQNEVGQLGDGTTTVRFTPVAVIGGHVFTSLTGGSHTCGVTTAGEAWCWGYGIVGQLGDGTTLFSQPTPVAVQGGITFASLVAGTYHTCGVTPAGAGYCWGYNAEGGLGDGTVGEHTTPVAVQGSLTFKAMTAGLNFTCGLTVAGAAYCWGHNAEGELGDGTTTPRTTPVVVQGGLTFSTISAGVRYTCGRTTAGADYCWGDNSVGQLGDGTTTGRLTPVAVIRP